jgi:Ca-activated chloride channel family protein
MTPSTEGQPLSSPTLALRSDRALIRAAARSRRFLLASVTAPEAPRRSDRQPVNVALVLDRSGSMAGSRKFDLARQAVEHALAMLRPEDRFSLVVYDDEVNVLTTSAHATNEAKRGALQALREVGPRGCTDLCGGWLRGCEQVAVHLSKDAVSRVLLLTDGLANQGITDHATVAHHASELRDRGVVTSTFGVGGDFDCFATWPMKAAATSTSSRRRHRSRISSPANSAKPSKSSCVVRYCTCSCLTARMPVP